MNSAIDDNTFQEIQRLLDHGDLGSATKRILKLKAKFPDDPLCLFLHARVKQITGILPPSEILVYLKPILYLSEEFPELHKLIEELRKEEHSDSKDITREIRFDTPLISSKGNPIDDYDLRDFVNKLDQNRINEVRAQLVKALVKVENPDLKRYFLVRVQYQDGLAEPLELLKELGTLSSRNMFPEYAELTAEIKKGPYQPPKVEGKKADKSTGFLKKAKDKKKKQELTRLFLKEGEIKEGEFLEILGYCCIFLVSSISLNFILRNVNEMKFLGTGGFIFLPPIIFSIFACFILSLALHPLKQSRNEVLFGISLVFIVLGGIIVDGSLFGFSYFSKKVPTLFSFLCFFLWLALVCGVSFFIAYYFKDTHFFVCAGCGVEANEDRYYPGFEDLDKARELFDSEKWDMFFEALKEGKSEKKIPFYIFSCHNCPQPINIIWDFFPTTLEKEMHEENPRIKSIDASELKDYLPDWLPPSEDLSKKESTADK
ncbi:hypothetical protein ACFL35_02405 [Candidatus Riflebacteria bacterium]